jgi:ectoine hydroxylase-related dioxygenase (phytanoyl-CoA dioxygenase family)
MKNLINPPKNLKNFPKNLKWSHNIIDYSVHDSYFVNNNKSYFLSLKVFFNFIKFFVINLTKRLIKYELIPLHVRSGKSLNLKFKFLFLAIKNTIGLKTKNFKKFSKNSIADSMNKFGISVVKIPDQDFLDLEKISKPHFDSLLQKRSNKTSNNRDFEDSRIYANRVSSPKLFTIIEDIFEKNGIMRGASSQLGRDVKLIDINPQINDKSDNFWSEIFKDKENLKFPETAYFHRDASGGDLKAIIYLTDVSNDNGPFTFSIGSHKISISKIDDWICETNDSSGFSSTEKNKRFEFSQLPEFLRQKGSFGNDLDPNSNFTKSILESSWKITASKGSIVLFDTKGAHRGGMVVNGQRRVITCVLG